MTSTAERNLIESWRDDLRREKQLQPTIDRERALLAAVALRRLMQSRRQVRGGVR